jgi:hypothetical protein
MSRDAKRPVGTWFELPLDDGVHFALGLLVGRPIPKVTEFAFFGPWNRPVTIDDVVGLRPGDEVRLVGLPTHACTEKLVTARGWVDLGVHPAVNTQDWYELGDRLIPNAFVQRDLTLALVEGWKPAHPTRPEQASSWWYWPAGKEWFEGFRGGIGIGACGAGGVDGRIWCGGVGCSNVCAGLVVHVQALVDARYRVGLD